MAYFFAKKQDGHLWWGAYMAYFLSAGTIAGFFTYALYEGQPSNSIVSSIVSDDITPVYT